METINETFQFTGFTTELVTYQFRGRNFVDFHGLNTLVNLPPSSLYKRTRKILSIIGEETVTYRYCGKVLYELKFAKEWWVTNRKMEREGLLKKL